MITVLVATGCLALGGFLGWGLTAYSFGKDIRIMRIPEDSIVVKREQLEKLIEVAQIKTKNPRLKFDARGVINAVAQDDDDES